MSVFSFFGCGGWSYDSLPDEWTNTFEPKEDCPYCSGSGLCKRNSVVREGALVPGPCDCTVPECDDDKKVVLPDHLKAAYDISPWSIELLKIGDYGLGVFLVFKDTFEGSKCARRCPAEPVEEDLDLNLLQKLIEALGFKYERPGWSFVWSW